MAKFEAVLWDFDGVLVDSEPVHYQAWNEVLTPLGVQLTEKDFYEKFVGIADRELVLKMAQGHDPPIDFNTLWGVYGKKQRLFLEKMGIDSVADLPELGAFVPEADVVEALEIGLRVDAADIIDLTDQS